MYICSSTERVYKDECVVRHKTPLSSASAPTNLDVFGLHSNPRELIVSRTAISLWGGGAQRRQSTIPLRVVCGM